MTTSDNDKGNIYEVQLPVGCCPACGKELLADFDLEQAVENVKEIGEKALQVCPVCGRDFYV